MYTVICLLIVSDVSFRMPPPVTGPSETELAMKVCHSLSLISNDDDNCNVYVNWPKLFHVLYCYKILHFRDLL